MVIIKDKLYPWLLLSVTSIGAFIQTLNLTTLNVALPVVADNFQAGAVASSWVLLSYMLVNTILILVFGKLCDIYGRRRLYLFGLAEFTVVSFFCGFSPNIGVLIILRALQAVGGALVVTNTTSLITDAFSERRLGTALSINITVCSIAQMIGPVVGGFMVFRFGWQWVFWLNVPFGIIGVIWGIITLKDIPGQARGEKVDLLGNFTVFLGLGGLILALSEGGVTGWSSFPVIVGLAMFVVFTSCFFLVERRAQYPMIDFSLFKNRLYAMANLAAFLSSTARSSVVLLIALFYQVVHHENPFIAGLKVLPLTVGIMIGSPMVGVLSAKYSTRSLSTIGLLGTCLGIFLLMWHVGINTSLLWVSFGQFLIGVGTGIFQTPNTKSIMMTVPLARRGSANGLRSMLQNMGQVLSTAFTLMIVTYFLPIHLKDAIYAGANTNLVANDRYLIVYGYRVALIVMLMLTVMAIAASYMRGNGEK